MVTSKKNPQNLVTLVKFFQKNPLYESHWVFFCHQVVKICQKKTLY